METGWRKNYLRYKSFFLNTMAQYHEKNDLRAYLEILLSLATISVFSIFALRPTILTIAELVTQIEEKKETVAKLDTKIQNLGKAQVLSDRENSNINLLTKFAIPNNPNSDVFARQVEGLSSKHLISLESLILDKGMLKTGAVSAPTEGEEDQKTTGKHSEIEFTLIMTGSVDQFSAFLSFINDFGKLRNTPLITRLSLSLKEANLTTKSLLLTIEGKLPYLPDSKIEDLVFQKL